MTACPAGRLNIKPFNNPTAKSELELIEISLTFASIAGWSMFAGGLSDDSKMWIRPSPVPFGEESAAHFPEART